MTATEIETFDGWQPLIVYPSEIKPGDWLSDLGTLRQGASVDAVSLQTGPGMIRILHFEPRPGIANTALGFSTQAGAATVWRAASPKSRAGMASGLRNVPRRPFNRPTKGPSHDHRG
jgi:hypothetical protein